MLHHNIQNKGERGVSIYVSSDLDSVFLKSSSNGPEFVKLITHKRNLITSGILAKHGVSDRAHARPISACNVLLTRAHELCG